MNQNVFKIVLQVKSCSELLTVADPEICPRVGPMTRKNCNPAYEAAIFFY